MTAGTVLPAARDSWKERAMQMRVALVALLLLASTAAAFQADLVPATRRQEAADITGTVSIGGADGVVRVVVESVNDPGGDPLTGQITVRLKLRVDGQRRHVTLPVTLDTGDGEATTSLGLTPGAQVIVNDVRVRGADHHTLAMAGAVTVAPAAPAPPTPPPPASECPAALQSCQADLDECNQELDVCESQ